MILIRPRPCVAGPLSTAPVLPLNCDPWHGQMNVLAAAEYATTHPWWGHTTSKATNVPASGCTTTAGSPELGAWNDAEPPTGTALAGPIRVPAGLLCVVGVDETEVVPPAAAVVPVVALGPVVVDVGLLNTGVAD